MNRRTFGYLSATLASCLALAGLLGCTTLNRDNAIAQPDTPSESEPMPAQSAIDPRLVTADNQFGFKLFRLYHSSHK